MSKYEEDNPYLKIRHNVHKPTKVISSKKDYKRKKNKVAKIIEEGLEEYYEDKNE